MHKNSNSSQHPVVLFDGVCMLCNGFVQFIIRRDKAGLFRFATLQSEIGQHWLEKSGLAGNELSTVLLVDGGQIYTHSDAALRIAGKLPGAFALLRGLSIIPKGLRDGVYNWVARNRYKWFGRKESCMIPSPDLRERFLS